MDNTWWTVDGDRLKCAVAIGGYRSWSIAKLTTRKVVTIFVRQCGSRAGDYRNFVRIIKSVRADIYEEAKCLLDLEPVEYWGEPHRRWTPWLSAGTYEMAFEEKIFWSFPHDDGIAHLSSRVQPYKACSYYGFQYDPAPHDPSQRPDIPVCEKCTRLQLMWELAA